jgi:hypothetical protein
MKVHPALDLAAWEVSISKLRRKAVTRERSKWWMVLFINVLFAGGSDRG